SLANGGHTSLQVPRIEPGVAAFGTRLLVVGGFDLQGGFETRVDVLDTLTYEWTRLMVAPVAWTHLQVAAVASTIYLLGGADGSQFIARGDAFSLDTLDPAPV